jgi:hypothetical protein
MPWITSEYARYDAGQGRYQLKVTCSWLDTMQVKEVSAESNLFMARFDKVAIALVCNEVVVDANS